MSDISDKFFSQVYFVFYVITYCFLDPQQLKAVPEATEQCRDTEPILGTNCTTKPTKTGI